MIGGIQMSKREIDRRTFLGGAATTAGATLLARWFPFREAFAAQAATLATRPEQARYADLRGSYDLDPKITYFNHASIGTMPRAVREAFIGYVAGCEGNPWYHIWGEAWVEAHEQVRAAAARLAGCTMEETALTHNTTECFNVLAAGLPLGPGDEVCFSSLSHSGASVCWHHQAETRGFTVRVFDFPMLETPDLSADDIVALHMKHVTDQTKVLIFPHIDNTLGIRHPVSALARAARARGVRYIAVDGAQSLGMIPVDLSALDIDFFATSPHKWVQSPKGRGLFYVRKRVLDELRPATVTWGRERWKDQARKFEDYGTRDMPSLLALGDALLFQEALGVEAKQAHLEALWAHAKARVAANPKLIWRSPNDWSLAGSLFAIELQGRTSKEVFGHMFEKHGFVFRPFHTDTLESFRLSPNAMNTKAELDRFFDLVERELA